MFLSCHTLATYRGHGHWDAEGARWAFAPEGDAEGGGDALVGGGIRVVQQAENADVVAATEAAE